ncbi:MAG: hypothetical protein G01um101433_1127 [Parcubacteria group bacterium Gr01-1014_33]|nr:MAG: hypothetical protein G01um101433_1127 [Parcubacteria group bacterium Gr01-1014_33]
MVKEKPNLVLLDIILPKKNGFDVLEELKKSPVTNAIPVIMLTMLGRDEDIKKGFELGANDYIVKSQHAVAEIVEKIIKFFGNEAHPAVAKAMADKPASAPSSPEATEGHNKATAGKPETAEIVDKVKETPK